MPGGKVSLEALTHASVCYGYMLLFHTYLSITQKAI